MRTQRRFRWLSAFLAPLIVLGVFCLCLAAESYLGKTVVIQRTGGRGPVTGTVVGENDKEITLQGSVGKFAVQRDDITGIEIKKSVQQEYGERKAKCTTVAQWLDLAKWCDRPDVNLDGERKACLEKVMDLDPENAEARAALGFVKRDGKWVNEEEEKKAQGLVKTKEGKWITKEEADRKAADQSGKAKGITKRSLESEGMPWAKAKTLKSSRGHYLLKCNSTEQVAQRYLKIMESLFTAYSELLAGFEPLYSGPGKIFVFRNRQEFQDFCLMQYGIGGYFSQIDLSVRTYHGSFGLTGNTDLVLAHEATHQFQHRIFQHFELAPFWFIEAMATYFGDGSRVRPDKVQLHVIPRDRLQVLQEAMNGGYYVPLKTLLRIHPAKGDNMLPCYDHGWGFLFWLLQGNNPKYKFGHKGEGKRIWDQFLRHVATGITPQANMNLFQNLDREAKYLQDLILKETKYESIEKWEEEYKKFILNLKLEPLGKWDGQRWDGFKEVGVKLLFPDGMKRVEEGSLRQVYREAAAATTADGLRLWLSIYDNPDQGLVDILKSLVGSTFTDKEFDPEYQDDEVKLTEKKLMGVMDVVETKFKGKFARRRESEVRQGSGMKGAEKKGEAKKAAPKPGAKDGGGPRSTNLPDFSLFHMVHIALLSTPDRIYMICLAGPESTTSKFGIYDAKFHDVLNSIRLNFELQAAK